MPYNCFIIIRKIYLRQDRIRLTEKKKKQIQFNLFKQCSQFKPFAVIKTIFYVLYNYSNINMYFKKNFFFVPNFKYTNKLILNQSKP